MKAHLESRGTQGVADQFNGMEWPTKGRPSVGSWSVWGGTNIKHCPVSGYLLENTTHILCHFLLTNLFKVQPQTSSNSGLRKRRFQGFQCQTQCCIIMCYWYYASGLYCMHSQELKPMHFVTLNLIYEPKYSLNLFITNSFVWKFFTFRDCTLLVSTLIFKRPFYQQSLYERPFFRCPRPPTLNPPFQLLMTIRFLAELFSLRCHIRMIRKGTCLGTAAQLNSSSSQC